MNDSVLSMAELSLLEGWFYASSVTGRSTGTIQAHQITTFLQLGKLGALELRSSISEGIPESGKRPLDSGSTPQGCRVAVVHAIRLVESLCLLLPVRRTPQV